MVEDNQEEQIATCLRRRGFEEKMLLLKFMSRGL